MATEFLHGVEMIEVQSGSSPISVVKAAVIGLIGIAPTGPKNEPVLVNSERAAAQFGSNLPGFTIPQALEAIRLQGAGTVLVINVFDEATHTSNVIDEAVAILNGAGKLANAPIGTVQLFIGAAEIDAADFTIDELGNITILDTVAVPDGNIVADYKKLDLAKVTEAVIVGDVEPYTGIKAFNKCFNTFGFTPKIYITPGFTQMATVRSELYAMADKHRGRVLVCSPKDTYTSAAIAGRGPAGTIGFNTANKRAVLLHPMLLNDKNEIVDYSAYFAGVWAKVINDFGYWYSPSNYELRGIQGTQTEVIGSYTDIEADTNMLNAAGIVTVFNGFGTGLRTWGNRSAAYPTDTNPRHSFLSGLLTSDIVDESIQQAAFKYVDKPINRTVFIDLVTEEVNDFLRTLQSRGALVGGKCELDQDENTAETLAAGQIVFKVSFMFPTPAERITFKSFVDINILKSLLNG